MRIAISIVLVAGIAALAGCGGSGGSSKGKAFVVLVTDINQLNDHGFNQLAYQGLLQAKKELGIRGEVYQSASAQAYIPNLSTAARKNADLVIAVGFDRRQGGITGIERQRIAVADRERVLVEFVRQRASFPTKTKLRWAQFAARIFGPEARVVISLSVMASCCP